MSAQTKLSGSRRYSAYHKDGLLDIFFGLLMLFAAAVFWSELTFMSGIWPAILVPLWISARSTITRQRVRPSELPAASQGRQMWFTITMIGLFSLGILAALALFVGLDSMPWLRSFLDENLPVIGGGMLSLILIILAAGLSTPRLLVYAICSIGAFTGAHLLGWPIWTGMLVVGAVALTGGIVILARFLQEHPG